MKKKVIIISAILILCISALIVTKVIMSKDEPKPDNEMEEYTIDGVTYYGDPYEDLDDSYELVTSNKYDALVQYYKDDESVVKYELWESSDTGRVATIVWYNNGSVLIQN